MAIHLEHLVARDEFCSRTRHVDALEKLLLQLLDSQTRAGFEHLLHLIREVLRCIGNEPQVLFSEMVDEVRDGGNRARVDAEQVTNHLGRCGVEFPRYVVESSNRARADCDADGSEEQFQLGRMREPRILASDFRQARLEKVEIGVMYPSEDPEQRLYVLGLNPFLRAQAALGQSELDLARDSRCSLAAEEHSCSGVVQACLLQWAEVQAG